jgi:folate-binding Fe-S cluster repair protein YgfZ
MSTLQGENWHEFLNNLQTNKIVNDHMAEIQGLVRFNRDPDQCLEQISKNSRTVNAAGRWFFRACAATQFGKPASQRL